MRSLTFERIKASAQSIWGKGCQVKVFGSFETQMYLPSRCVFCYSFASLIIGSLIVNDRVVISTLLSLNQRL